MAPQLKQTQHLGQHMAQRMQLRMTQQLRQAIQILAMPNIELATFVEEQLQENPLLELAPEEMSPADAPPAPASETTRAENDPNAKEGEAPSEWLDFPHATRSSAGGWDDERPSALDFQRAPRGLTDHLEEQLREIRIDPEIADLARVIIHNLDEDGYLRDLSLEDIALTHDVDLDRVERALAVVHTMEPAGVGARDLGECLLIQVDALDEPVRTWVEEIAKHHIPALERGQHVLIAKAMQIRPEQVVEAHRALRTLNPRPALPFAGSIQDYVVPDVIVRRSEEGWTAFLNEGTLPALRLSTSYVKLSKTKAPGASESKAYLKQKLREAEELFRAIDRRRHTILRVTEALLHFQRDFFEEGMTGLKPLVLRDVAEAIETSESTVSRVTANKYVQTPRGVFPMKMFFSASLRSHDGDDVAARSVKKRIQEMIQSEAPGKPLSDQKIADLLRDDHGVDIARRTVAKYREEMHILPSSRRKSAL